MVSFQFSWGFAKADNDSVDGRTNDRKANSSEQKTCQKANDKASRSGMIDTNVIEHVGTETANEQTDQARSQTHSD
jgi:hypothetical protein